MGPYEESPASSRNNSAIELSRQTPALVSIFLARVSACREVSPNTVIGLTAWACIVRIDCGTERDHATDLGRTGMGQVDAAGSSNAGRVSHRSRSPRTGDERGCLSRGRRQSTRPRHLARLAASALERAAGVRSHDPKTAPRHNPVSASPTPLSAARHDLQHAV